MQRSIPGILFQALAYTELGYRVIPVVPGGKRPHSPLVPHGINDATCDRVVVELWWRVCPYCGVALVPPRKVLVLDVDVPDAWAELSGLTGVEEAPRARTPSGGWHLWFWVGPDGDRLKATVRALLGVDLRGLGRTALVVPPTPGYVWEVPLLPAHSLPPLPEALRRKLLPKDSKPKRAVPFEGSALPGQLEGLLRWAFRRVAEAPVGTRHHTLLKTARLLGGYAHMGFSEDVVVSALTEAAIQAGLPRSEALATARDGFRYGLKAPIWKLDLEPVWREARSRRFRALGGRS
jgi:Bifunctional DNA primase/polymerase, N-terminal.